MNQAEISILLKARDEATKVLQGVRGQVDKLGGALKTGLKIGAAVGAGGLLALGAAGFQAFKSLARIEQIGAQTDAAIKSTGGAANVTRAEIDKLAGTLENLTSVEAETITEGQNLLLTFTGIQNKVGAGNDIFDQATKTMLDMSVALKQDMSSSAIQLGKALNDPIQGMTALRRVGVSFTQEQIAQVKAMQDAGDLMGAQKLILAELTKEFGGSAKALGQTMGGQLAIFQHQLGTVAETVVTAFLPIFGLIVQGLLKLTPHLQAGAQAFADFVSFIGSGLAGDVEAAAEAFALLPGPLQKIALWLVENKPQIDDLIAKLEDLAVTVRKLSEDVFSGWVIILVALWPKLQDLGKWLEDNEPVLIALVAAAVVLIAIFGGWAVAIAAIIIGVGWLTDKINDSIKSGGYWAGVVERIGNAIEVTTMILKGMEDGLNKANDAVTAAGEATNRVLVAALDELKRILEATLAPLDWIRDRVYQAKDAFYSLRDAAYAVRDAIKSIPVPKLPSLSGVPGILGFADGGILPRGLSLVGERGPELVYSGNGGQRVFSNSESARMLGDNVTNNTYYVYPHQIVLSGDPAAGLSALGVSL